MRNFLENMRPQALLMTLVIVLAIALGFRLSRFLTPSEQRLTAQTVVAIPSAPEHALRIAEQLQDAFGWVARKMEPSVVTIMAPRPLMPRLQFRFPPLPFERDPFEEYFRRFFERGIPDPKEEGKKPQLRPRGAGVLVSADGHILTNRHIIEGVNQIVVSLWNDKRFEAKVIGSDEPTDIAVLKIEPADTKLVPATLGDSDKVRAGDWAIAIGNPFGLRQTMTVGIVSAIGRRPYETGATIGYTEFIQTDAAINMGNSGGPLCNIRGEVIGINTAIISPTGIGVGVGFSIPINTAKFIMEQLLKQGKVVRGWLGVELMDIDQLDDPTALGLKEMQGVIVQKVLPNSPAEKAGLKPQDVIVEFNGIPVRNIPHIQSLVGRTTPGTSVPIKIVRGGKRMTLTVQLAERTEEVVAEAQQETKWRGMIVGELTPELREQLGLPATVKGVVVLMVHPGSPAAKVDIRQGDVITVLANREIASVRDFVRVTQAIRPERSAPVTLRREGNTMMLVIPPEK